MDKLVERFLRYIKVPTQSSHDDSKVPSTDRQFNLAKLLGDELRAMGLSDVKVSDHAYVTAKLKGNKANVPTIGLISHIDTALDVTDEGMNPRIVKKYDGSIIDLDGKGTVLSPEKFPSLKDHIGDDLIVTDGTTLLGADDKAGVAEIITAVEYLQSHPEIQRGDLAICFCPDEEIGHGASLLDLKDFGAEFAYTVDSMGIGDINYETFNAAGANVTFNGLSVHPGTAKNSMINACLLATEFINALPPAESPAHTEGYEGFYHVIESQVSVEGGTLELIIRDHDSEKFEARKEFVKLIVRQMNERWKREVASVEIHDQYRNMAEVVMSRPEIVEIAVQAIKNVGLEPKISPVRGGTDGSQLSMRGLPTPNLFYGGYNAHGKYEYASIQAMEAATKTLIELVRLWGTK